MTKPKEIEERLKEIVGQAYVKTAPDETAQYAVDGMAPRAAVFPKDVRQVSQVIAFASKNNLAVVPRGSGSKMSAGHPPRRIDILVSTTRLNHMLDVDTANLTMTVEAGVKFRDIQARLATQEDRCYLPIERLETAADGAICSERSNSGCFVPLDPPFSAKATIGGILAADSTGPRRLLYGLPRDLVLGVRFVTPNGEIIGTGGKTVKNVSGYDISKLMIGSAGSLGVLCDTTLRLLPLPERMETVFLSFGSFEATCAAVEGILETPLLPAAVDVIKGDALETLKPLKEHIGAGGYVVATALESFAETVDRMRIEILNIAKNCNGKTNTVLSREDHQWFWLFLGELQTVLENRFAGLIGMKLNYRLSDWKTIIPLAEKILSSGNLRYTIQCHAGSGICLINLLLDEQTASTAEQVIVVVEALLKGATEAGGNLVIQRAPLDLKPRLPIWGAVRPDLSVMTRIKKQADPLGIMSPGRFVGGL